jgi:hypothetical protein
MTDKKKKSHWARRLIDPTAPGSHWFERLSALGNDATALIMGAGFFKDGGRVRGVGKAKRGFGKVLRNKK